MHLIGRNVRGDRTPLQSRAHHREIRRRKNDHPHGSRAKERGTARDAGFSKFCNRTTIERKEIGLREVSWDMESNVLIKRGEYRRGVIQPVRSYGYILQIDGDNSAAVIQGRSACRHERTFAPGWSETSQKERSISIFAEEGTGMRWRTFEIASEVTQRDGQR